MQAALAEEESRKAARRHLAKWAKIMLQIVGLERVAEELMGRRSWASYQDAMVGQECRTSEPICAPSQTVGDSGERSGSSSPRAMAASSPATWYIKPSASPEILDQPLDLSAKPTPQPAVVQPIKIPSPNKHIFKAKPRLSTVAGRRTYTEEELQAALRDIQSGKLGTRRAAVIYGIPRSTLRNKVYKLSQERRDTGGLESAKDDDDDDDDRDLSEEEREVEKALMRPLLSMDDVRLPDGRAWPYLQQLLGGTQVLPELVRNIMAEDRLMRANATRPSCSTEKPDDNVILRVPSFRPKDSGSPLSGRQSDSESPPAKTHALSLRDVISNTITNKLTAAQDAGIVSIPTASTMPLDFRRDAVRNHNNNHMDDKKLGIGKPCVPSALHNNNSQMSSSNSSTSGGKGTRPKRGKYRNYDRDSLVEAVRAVQRGEMSVHRAGSYYGVPHSTLEYKVKERHLMRPRKREPKPPQVQTSDNESKRKEDRSRLQRFTPPLVQPANGLKVPPGFDPATLAAAAAYPPALPFPFWPSAPFAALPGLDYASRELFAQQMMQRLHEDSAAVAGSGVAAVPNTTASTASSSSSTTTTSTATTPPALTPSSGSGNTDRGGGGSVSPPALGKTTREIAESLLYDSSSDNGNFLDGIIRSSLETGIPPGGAVKEAGKALIEHLCRSGALASDSDKVPEPPIKEPPKTSPSPDRPSSACDTAQC